GKISVDRVAVGRCELKLSRPRWGNEQEVHVVRNGKREIAEVAGLSRSSRFQMEERESPRACICPFQAAVEWHLIFRRSRVSHAEHGDQRKRETSRGTETFHGLFPFGLRDMVVNGPDAQTVAPVQRLFFEKI